MDIFNILKYVNFFNFIDNFTFAILCKFVNKINVDARGYGTPTATPSSIHNYSIYIKKDMD